MLSAILHKSCILDSKYSYRPGMAMEQSDKKSSGKKHSDSTSGNAQTEKGRSLGTSLVRAAEQETKDVVRIRNRELWLSENQASLKGSNIYVEQNGVPLESFRNF